MPKKPLSPNPYIQVDHDSAFATKPLPVPFDFPKSPTSAAQNIPVKVCSVLHLAWMLMLHDEDLKGLLIQRTQISLLIEDNLQMEMKCTMHSCQMVTNVDDGPGEKKMLKESYS